MVFSGVLIFPRGVIFFHIHVLKQRLSVPARTALWYGSNEQQQSFEQKKEHINNFLS